MWWSAPEIRYKGYLLKLLYLVKWIEKQKKFWFFYNTYVHTKCVSSCFKAIEYHVHAYSYTTTATTILQ